MGRYHPRRITHKPMGKNPKKLVSQAQRIAQLKTLSNPTPSQVRDILFWSATNPSKTKRRKRRVALQDRINSTKRPLSHIENLELTVLPMVEKGNYPDEIIKFLKQKVPD